jgi:hypothetical protein
MPIDHDLVEVILDPYDRRIRVWDRDGRSYTQGDKVPAVGMAVTYAVRLYGPADAPARYLWVQDGVITNPMAHQPITHASVFCAWGRYLGRGGDPLEAPSTGTVGPKHVLGETPVEAPPTAGIVSAPSILRHSFHLRPNFKVRVDLPSDLDEHDVARLTTFLSSLPFARLRSS